MVSFTSAASRAASVFAVVTCLAVINGRTVVAANIKIGTVVGVASNADFISDQLDVDAAQHVATGLFAAVKEANDKNVFPGHTFELRSEAGANAFGEGYPQAARLRTQDGVVAMAGLSYYHTDAVLDYANTTDMPVFGGNSAIPTAFVQKRQVVNYRLPNTIEVQMLVNFAVRSSLGCTRFGIVWYESAFVTPLMEVARQMILAFGYDDPVKLRLGDGASYANYTPMDPFLARAELVPNCVVLLLDPSSVLRVINYWMTKSTVNPSETSFLTHSGANVPNWTVRFHGGRVPRLYICQQFPDPENAAKTLVVKSFQAAMVSLASSGVKIPVRNGTATVMLTPATAFDFFALEGYISGRMAIDFVVRGGNPTPTPTSLLDSVYRNSVITIDDIVLGPFVDQCRGSLQTRSVLPCDCHTGNRFLYIDRVDFEAGKAVEIDDGELFRSDGILGSAVQKVPLSRCDGIAVVPVTVFATAVAKADHMTPQAKRDRAAMLHVVHQTLALVNAAGYFQNQRSARLIDLGELPDDRAERFHFLAGVKRRYLPYAFIGLDLSPAEWKAFGVEERRIDRSLGLSHLAAAFRFGKGTRAMRLEELPVTEWTNATIELDAVLADYVHALSSLLAADAGAGVVVFATSEAEASLAVRSLETFGRRPGGVSIGRTAADATAFAGIALRSQSRLNVLVVTQDFDVALALLRVWVGDGRSAARLLFATNEALLYDVLDSLLDPAVPNITVSTKLAVPNPPLILFSSVMTEFWPPPLDVLTSSSSSFGKLYWGIVSEGGTKIDSLSELFFRPVGALAFRSASIIFTAMNAVTTNYSPSSFARAFYELQTLAFADFSVGPFSDDPCPASVLVSNTRQRVCQCSKGPRVFHVHELSAWVKHTVGSRFPSYVMKNCGVEYTTIPDVIDFAQALTIAGSIAAVLAAFSVGIAIKVILTPKRNNSLAVKDGSLPFTVAFTDIQSSTNLWARVPAAMSAAVEAHHEELRKLVRKYDGYEVKTIGDSFMVVFKEPIRAVEFGLAIQTTLYAYDWGTNDLDRTYQELYEEKLAEAAPLDSHGLIGSTADPMAGNMGPLWKGLRVRVGLHFGTGNVKLDAVSLGYDYYGTVVNTAARVEGVGNGGQVLVTEPLMDVVRSKLGSDVIVTDMGPQPLRGLDAPVTMFQLLPGALAGRTFPALRLDVEVKHEEHEQADDPRAPGVVLDGTSTASSLAPEATLDQFVRRFHTQHSPALVTQAGYTAYHFVRLMLSTSKLSFRKEVIETVAKKWHVHLSDVPRDKDAAADQALMKIVVKIVPPLLEALRTTHTFSDSSSNHVNPVTPASALARPPISFSDSTSQDMPSRRRFSVEEQVLSPMLPGRVFSDEPAERKPAGSPLAKDS